MAWSWDQAIPCHFSRTAETLILWAIPQEEERERSTAVTKFVTPTAGIRQTAEKNVVPAIIFHGRPHRAVPTSCKVLTLQIDEEEIEEWF